MMLYELIQIYEPNNTWVMLVGSLTECIRYQRYTTPKGRYLIRRRDRLR